MCVLLCGSDVVVWWCWCFWLVVAVVDCRVLVCVCWVVWRYGLVRLECVVMQERFVCKLVMSLLRGGVCLCVFVFFVRLGG